MKIIFWENEETAKSGLRNQLVKIGHIVESKQGVGFWRDLFYLNRQKPDVVHIFVDKLPLAVAVFSRFQPNTEVVLTTDTVVKNSRAVVTTQSQTANYQLQKSGLDAAYIPTGFEPDFLQPLAAKVFGLRKGGYAVILADDMASVRLLRRLYGKTKSRKKLFTPKEVEATTPRRLRSLLANAAVVLVGEEVDKQVLLQAAADKVALVAAGTASNREILGAAAQFFPAAALVKERQYTGATRDGIFVTALKDVLKNSRRQAFWGRRAQKRVLSQFTWERLAPEYLNVYAGTNKRLVAVDSLQAKTFTQPV